MKKAFRNAAMALAAPALSAFSLQDNIETAMRGTVKIIVENESYHSEGSGFLIDDEGHILTNDHVIAHNGTRITVEFDDEKKIPATLVGGNATADIAVLKIDPPMDRPPLPVDETSKLRVGDPVIEVGNPLGFGWSVTRGIVSGLHRKVASQGSDHAMATFQYDASTNPGNSGGPIVNEGGKVIGVADMIVSGPVRMPMSIGLAFAIPAGDAMTTARAILNQSPKLALQ